MLFSSLPHRLFSGWLHEEPKLLIILNYLYLHILSSLLSQLLPHSNPPCQLSLWEETGEPGENPRRDWTYNPGNNDWDNRLKINPEIKFPSEKSKFNTPFPPNNVDDHLHQPQFVFNFFQPTLGEGVDVFLGNLVNCDDHVPLYTGVPMNFGQDWEWILNTTKRIVILVILKTHIRASQRTLKGGVAWLL